MTARACRTGPEAKKESHILFERELALLVMLQGESIWKGGGGGVGGRGGQS